MSSDKRCIIDLREMGERYGLKMTDIVKDGKVIMRDHVWDKQALQRAVKECHERSRGAEIAELRGHLPNWALSAMAYSVLPAICYFEIGPGGMYHMNSTPFKISEEKPTCGLFFDVDEKDGENVYVKAWTDAPHADAHGFDLSRFGDIILPPIGKNKNVYLSGEVVNPIAVSMVLAYASEARSVFMRFHEEPNYYCCVTNTDDIEIGDSKAAADVS